MIHWSFAWAQYNKYKVVVLDDYIKTVFLPKHKKYAELVDE